LSFNYADYQSATIVNNACKFKQVASTIFLDESIWNGALKKGEAGIRELVDTAVSRSDVTAFLVGRTTYSNKWCLYALRQCIEKKKGVFGIHLPNQMSPGRAEWLTGKGFPVHEWDSNSLKSYIITAVQKSLTKAS
jgi:hypothetical protein